MQYNIKFVTIFFFLAIFLIVPHLVFAAPAISAITGNLSNGQNITINGSGFGTKTIVAPNYFSNFDSDSIGQLPSGWVGLNDKKGLISNVNSHSGSNALDTSAIEAVGEYFNRIYLDLGTEKSFDKYLYLSAWLYLDQTGTTANEWNWKGPLVTSNNNPVDEQDYWQTSGKTTNDVAMGFAGFWDTTNGWKGTAAVVQYSLDGKAYQSNCYHDPPVSQNGWASDSFVFGSWQRVEWIYKRSSASGLDDGAFTVNRIGKSDPALNTPCDNYGNTSNMWRYLSLPQGFTNITLDGVTNAGVLNLKMYFDDVYVDNTIARIELCDASTWLARAHCEIQKPTTWSDTSLTAALNQGSFATGTAYLYVVDGSGDVNANGYAVTLTGTSDTTAPTAPSGLSVI